MANLTGQIKAALMNYWRYRRGFIAVPEIYITWWIADILAYKNGIVVEVEIKSLINQPMRING